MIELFCAQRSTTECGSSATSLPTRDRKLTEFGRSEESWTTVLASTTGASRFANMSM